jgi:NADH dehydrogenase
MKVLITGGTGYVGGHLRDYIHDQGHEVRLLVRPGSEHKLSATDHYEIVVGDIFDTNACLHACDGCDAVVHLVGIIREFPEHGITFDQCHRVVTANMINGARICGIERFVHMSALGTRADAVSEYHKTRYAAEQLVQEAPLRWTIFRPSWIFGRGDHLIPQFLDLVRHSIIPIVAGGKTLLRPVAVENVCEAMARSLQMPETQSGTFELGGADELSLREVIEKIAQLTGSKGRFMNVPAWALKPVVGVMQRYPWFPLTRDQLLMLNENNTCEVDHFVKTFRIEPTSFREALPALLEAERQSQTLTSAFM